MRTYFIIWVGEVASTLGSGLTSFALGLWIYERTGSVSLLTFNMLAYLVPDLLLTPLAGVVADRWNRKALMVLGDAGAGLGSFIVFLLAMSGNLQIWHIYLLTIFSAAFGALQWPAYTAAIPQIVPKQHLGRASAMSQAGEALSEMASPFIAGSLYVLPGVGLRGILFIDFATLAFSTLTLLLARIPHHRHVAMHADAGDDNLAAGFNLRSVREDLRQGWDYIVQRPALLRLMAYFALLNFVESFIYPLAQPLLFETVPPDAAGRAMSVMAVGMLIGIGIMTIWGGPKRRIYGILIPAILSGLAIALAGLRPSLTLITVAGFTYFALMPIIDGSDQALWQTKIAENVQGRVFAMRSMIATSISPLALLIVGPLTDHVFEPLLQPDGALADSAGLIFGTGPGRGIGLFITLLGLLSALVSVLAYLNPRVRTVEDDLPDAHHSDKTHASLIAD